MVKVAEKCYGDTHFETEGEQDKSSGLTQTRQEN
jgi:hypothetical protein